MREVEVVVLNFNGGDLVLRTLHSLRAQQGVRCTFVVVDDGSTDGSPDEIQRVYPSARIYRNARNTRDVNRLRNIGIRMGTTPRVLLTDNDLVYEENCVRVLMETMDADPQIAACMPCLRYLDETETVYLAGTQLHYVATTIAEDRDAPAESLGKEPRFGIGGGIALFDVSRFNEVGGFDEDFALAWGDDGELHQRLILAGYECVFVPTAVAYHEEKPFSKSRYYRASGQVQNRFRLLLSHYEWRTLIVLFPALLLFELAQIGFFVLKGIPHLYLKGVWGTFSHLPDIREKRRVVQALRRAPDRDVLYAGPLYVRPHGGFVDRLTGYILKGLSWIFDRYWSAARKALRPTRSLPLDSSLGG